MSGVMGSLIQALRHFRWASHQQFTQIIRLRALRPVHKGSPDISPLQFQDLAWNLQSIQDTLPKLNCLEQNRIIFLIVKSPGLQEPSWRRPSD